MRIISWIVALTPVLLVHERQPADVDAVEPAAAALPRAVIVAAAAELALAINRADIQ